MKKVVVVAKFCSLMLRSLQKSEINKNALDVLGDNVNDVSDAYADLCGGLATDYYELLKDYL